MRRPDTYNEYVKHATDICKNPTTWAVEKYYSHAEWWADQLIGAPGYLLKSEFWELSTAMVHLMEQVLEDDGA